MFFIQINSPYLFFISVSENLRSANGAYSPSIPGSERTQCSDGATPPPSRTDTMAKLKRLRVEMRRRTVVLGAELDAYIVPSYDEHQVKNNFHSTHYHLKGFQIFNSTTE